MNEVYHKYIPLSSAHTVLLPSAVYTWRAYYTLPYGTVSRSVVFCINELLYILLKIVQDLKSIKM